MNMNLYRDKDTIYRSLSPTEEETTPTYVKSPKDLFEFKQRELQSYYYGSDDEGDIKDLRKNIAIGFKKYQQTKTSSDLWFYSFITQVWRNKAIYQSFILRICHIY